MNDDFNAMLFKLAAKSPELQKAILNSTTIKTSGYSIPTGSITVTDKKLLPAIKKVRELRVKDLDRILSELRPAIILEEVEGKEIPEYKKTLRDIDITTLALFALVSWAKEVQQNRSETETGNKETTP